MGREGRCQARRCHKLPQRARDGKRQRLPPACCPASWRIYIKASGRVAARLLHLRGELLQDSCQIRLRLQNRANRVNGNSLHALDRVSDRKCLRIELRVYLVPEQRHRNGRTWKRPGAEGRNDRLSVTILQVIEIDFVSALCYVTGDRPNVFQLTQHATRKELAKHARLLVRAMPAHW